MPILIVANDPRQWPFEIPGVEVVDARSYLTNPEYNERRGTKLLNLCRSYRYQSIGYYVSLLAEARGHQPLPNVITIQDMKSPTRVRLVSDELDELIQKNLAAIQSDKFTLSIYFGRNLSRKYDRLVMQLFNMFQAPLLRAEFSRDTARHWQLRSVAAISASEVPDSHRPFVVETAGKYFAGRRTGRPKAIHYRYDLAILHNPNEKEPPSDEKALKKFVKAAELLGMQTELITRDDFARLSEFDALFLRETTNVNHHTYRFARRATNEGLVVMDDPISIVRCTNKVYLAELLKRHNVPTPRTVVAHRGNAAELAAELGLPCVLKKPDSAFSAGVIKADTAEELSSRLSEFLDDSELVVAQEYLPSDFDWRIGIIDRVPLYACKYFMASHHWQIMKTGEDGKTRYGRWETIPIESAPRRCTAVALKAANLIGDGLYGVDVKELNGKFYVIEVNDNPSIESGVEDLVLRDELYKRIMNVFLRRIERRKAGTYSYD